MTDQLPTASHAGSKADVGILCVHGIGVQVEGETLRNVAGPLFNQFARGGAMVEYGETILKPRQRLDAGPARISATIADGDTRKSLVIAESRWADVFDAPSYSQLLGWLMSHGTWIAIRHAVFSFSAPVRYFERRYHRRGKPRPDWLGFADTMVAYPAAWVSVFLVALPAQLFLLAVGALAVLPFAWTKTLAQRIALGASAILGDASVYSADTTLRHAILTRVRADLDWVSERTRTTGPVVILAHSQGAAVVYDLLSSIRDLSRIRLITYGEGIRKLTELETGARERPFIVSVCGVLWVFALLAIVAGWFAVIYVIESFATPGAAAISDRVGSLLFFYLFGFALLSTAIYHAARAREAKVDQPVAAGVSLLLAKHLEWVDLYASSDPVARGPLLGAEAMKDDGHGWRVAAVGFPGFRSRRVINRLSTIGDHTSYWSAPNDFVPLVAREIASWIGLSAGLVAPAGRLWRLTFRWAAGLAIVMLGILTFWRAGDPLRDVIWMRAWGLIPFEPHSIASQVVARYSLREPAVFLAGFAAFLAAAFCYGRFVLDPAWTSWERALFDRPAGAIPHHESAGGARRYWARRWAPLARLFVCLLVVATPIGIFVGSIRRGDYGPTLASVTSLAESGRTLAGWIFVAVFYLAALVVVIGVGRKIYEWWRGGNGT